MSAEDQEQMMERARWLEQRQARPPTPHVHPDTVNDLERRVAALEKVPPTLVYAHVERTVHALLDAIADSLPAAIGPDRVGVTPCDIEMLAEAVQALSSWKPPTCPAGYSLEAPR